MTSEHRIKAVVFDWAGTVIDFGSLAPVGAVVDAFGRFGVTISIAEARRPMGLPKRDHLRALLADASIARRWHDARGSAADDAALDELYETFRPLNLATVTAYADLIPGVVPVVEALRQRGAKIGSTTGYTREIMERLLPLAARQGFTPDNVVCADDLAAGRPSPLMMYRTFADLGVYPPAAVVKVDDTEPGIAEGIAAGSWAIGIAMTGNICGLSEAALNALSTSERDAIRTRATRTLRAAGAHEVIDSVADLLPVLERLEMREIFEP